MSRTRKTAAKAAPAKNETKAKAVTAPAPPDFAVLKCAA